MIILTGASASGKTATALELMKNYHFQKAVTTTTRTKRLNEVNGVDYFFLSKEEFLLKKQQNLFVETTFYNGNYYGCGIEQIADDKVIVVDPNGLNSFHSLKKEKIVSFCLECPENIRYQRMINRGNTEIEALERIKNDRLDFAEDKIKIATFRVATDIHNVAEVAKIIADLYQKALKS